MNTVTQLGFLPKMPTPPLDLTNRSIRESWIKEKGMLVYSFYQPKNPFEILDVFIKEPKPFDELFKNRFTVQAFGLEIPVISKKDLIEMKKTAGRDKDLFDITQLEKHDSRKQP